MQSKESQFSGRFTSDEIRELVVRAKEGDEEAFGHLYKEHFSPIYRFVFFRTKRRQDAEDITQTTFLRALQSIERYEESNVPFLAWLYTIARNLVIDHYKKHKDVLVSEPEVVFAELPEPKYQADREALESDRAQMLSKAIASLPEDQQVVIIMRSIEERSYEEIALVLDKNEEAVRALKSRAVKNLKEYLEKNESRQ